MNTEQVIEQIRDTLGRHTGSELELFEALETEADGWRMRLQELRSEDGSEDNDEGEST